MAAEDGGPEDAAATSDEQEPPSRPRRSIRRALRRASNILGLAPETEADPVQRMLNGRGRADGQSEAATAKEIDEESLLLQNVMQLRDLRVEDVMVPRADIVSVESHATLSEVLDAFREGSHSRLPVYRETLDDPIGVIHLKDLALSHGFGAAADDFSLADHLRSVLAVPASMKVRALLERMQASRRHMALVIDEYGGVDGLVTIEDIIEQIVGAIEDEHDDAEGPLWRKQPDGAYIAEARAYVDDFQDATGATLLLEDWDEDVDTLGGLIFMICGRVPERGEVIRHPLDHEFEIVDADPRRIKRIRVRLAEKSETAESGSTAPASEESDVVLLDRASAERKADEERNDTILDKAGAPDVRAENAADVADGESGGKNPDASQGAAA